VRRYKDRHRQLDSVQDEGEGHFFERGPMCGWGMRRYKDRHRQLDTVQDESERRLSDLESRVKRLGERSRERAMRPVSDRGDAEAVSPSSRPKKKSRLEELQQEFVEGRLTMAEYEKELDRLEKLE
jgi:hypothetical protein